MTRYEKGFIEKCAEYGVDGETLLKQAKSTYGHELGGFTVNGLIPYVGTIPNAIGSTLGSLNARDLSDEELDELSQERGNGMNYLPGVAAYRLAQRSGAVNKAVVDRAKELGIKSVRPTRHAFTEGLSGLVNPLNWVASPIGALIAAGKPHRTLDEQVKHDSKSQSWKNLLIPGYGGYNGALRGGASRDVMENRKKKDENQDKPVAEKQSEAGLTRYERGFLSKCAEAGIPAATAVRILEKRALSPLGGTLAGAAGGGLAGALGTIVPAGIGAGIGALVPTDEKDEALAKKKRRMNMLWGGVAGLGARNVASAVMTKNPFMLAGGVLPAGIGAAIGGLTGKTKEDRKRRALKGWLYGDLAGGTLGGAAAGGLVGNVLARD